MSALPRRIAFSARDGLRLSATEWPGDPRAVPLLCLPGIARTALDFTGIALRHRGRRRVVALDYAGHGESGRATDPARYRGELAIRDLMDALAARHLHRVALLGTSFGGTLGMALGLLRPGALAALALNDTGPRIAPMGIEAVRAFIGRDPAFASIEEAAAFLHRILPPLGIPDAGWRALAETTYAIGRDGRLHPRWDTRILQAMPREAGPTELWPLFYGLPAIPLLLIRGEASTILSAETARRMRKTRPEMAFTSLPGIGHAPTRTAPASLTALDRWLAELG